MKVKSSQLMKSKFFKIATRGHFEKMNSNNFNLVLYLFSLSEMEENFPLRFILLCNNLASKANIWSMQKRKMRQRSKHDADYFSELFSFYL